MSDMHCPFCESMSSSIVRIQGYGDPPSFRVQCDICGARGPVVPAFMRSKNPALDNLSEADAEHKARWYWNNRW